MKAKFKGFDKAVSNDNLTPQIQYFVVKDGKIIVTNGFLIVIADADLYFSNDECKYLEGKILHRELLKKMCKASVTNIELTIDKIKIHDKRSTLVEEYTYSGTIVEGVLYDNSNIRIGKFPETKTYSEQEYGGSSNKVGLNLSMLNIINECFSNSKNNEGVSIQFHQDKNAIGMKILPVPNSNKEYAILAHMILK